MTHAQAHALVLFTAGEALAQLRASFPRLAPLWAIYGRALARAADAFAVAAAQREGRFARPADASPN